MMVRKMVGVHEKTVQKAARGEIKKPRRAVRTTRSRNSKVEVKHWYDGVDPLIIKWVRENKIHYSRIEVESATSIIVRAKKG